MTDHYREQLRHPKWQRRRLERLSAADWKCSRCIADEKPLHVHHRLYRSGAQPWEYVDDELEVLCEDCHTIEHKDSFTRAEVIELLTQALARERERHQSELDLIWLMRREALDETPAARAARWAQADAIRNHGATRQ